MAARDYKTHRVQHRQRTVPVPTLDRGRLVIGCSCLRKAIGCNVSSTPRRFVLSDHLAGVEQEVVLSLVPHDERRRVGPPVRRADHFHVRLARRAGKLMYVAGDRAGHELKDKTASAIELYSLLEMLIL